MRFPTIALKGLVTFPGGIYTVDVGREKSRKALDEAMATDRLVFLVSQINEEIELPETNDLYEVGTVCKIKQMIKVRENGVRVVFEALYCGSVIHFYDDNKEYLDFEIEKVERYTKDELAIDEEATCNIVKNLFASYVKKSDGLPKELITIVSAVDRAGELSDKITDCMKLPFNEKQEILEIFEPEVRITLVMKKLQHQIRIIEVEEKLNKKVNLQMSKNQMDYYLREKIKAIKEELGDSDEADNDIEMWKQKLDELPIDENSRKKLEKEIKRFSYMQPASAEASVIRTYIETVLELPWGVLDEEIKDLKISEDILQKDHYGLEKIKERVVEHLAVLKFAEAKKAPILCFVGPPGTGKTSISKSIAKATGRRFVRMSLGGVRDEAEIRGHRRTYIGAIPGRIIDSIKTVGSQNPVFLLDEIDKLGADYKGDPSSALLEVLDPEQNKEFVDHYLEIPFDLSNVMFITTANTLDTIPAPLRDRMEIIQVSAYTEQEKKEIAKRYLVPKKLEEVGISKSQFSMTDKAISDTISYYTREAGVRGLEKTIGTLVRKVAKKIALGELEKDKIKPSNLEDYLGKKRYRYDKITGKSQIGVATGMAWTAVGGDTLFIETSALPGTGKIQLTGQLGNVMQESAKTGISYVRSVAEKYGIDTEFYKNKDIHIHVPEGAVPKDGPSAGVTMSVAMISTLSNTPIRKDVSMTGEVTLTGNVLAVGGIKEKVLAAHRAGVKKVLLPIDNKRDIDDIPEKVREDLEFVLLENVDDALKEALVR